MRDEFRTAVEKWEAVRRRAARSTRGLPGPDRGRNSLVWIDTHNPQMSPVALEFVAGMRRYLPARSGTRQAVWWRSASSRHRRRAWRWWPTPTRGRATKSAEAANKSEKEAKASAHQAQVRAATLALDRGVQLSERGGRGRAAGAWPTPSRRAPRPTPARTPATSAGSSLQTSALGPPAAVLDDVRTFPGATLATDPAGTVVLCRTKEACKRFATDGPPGRRPARSVRRSVPAGHHRHGRDVGRNPPRRRTVS